MRNRTLVLDRGYQPHRVVPWQRAVVMLFGGKAEVLEEYEDVVRSVSLSIRMPSVVRLVRGGRPKRAIKFSRFNVMLRDGFTCQYCRRELPMRQLTYDHVVPRARGGRTGWNNIVTACRPCNGRKGDRTPKEAGMVLPHPPVKPDWLPTTASKLRRDGYPPSWGFWVPQLAADA